MGALALAFFTVFRLITSAVSLSEVNLELPREFADLQNVQSMVVYNQLEPPDYQRIENGLYKSRSSIPTAVLRLNEESINTIHLDPKADTETVLKLFFFDNLPDRQLLENMVDAEHWAEEVFWLAFLPGRVNVELVNQMFGNASLKYTSKVFLVDTSEDVMVLSEVYKISASDASVQFSHYGSFTEEKGLKVDERDIWRRRANLKGKHLRVVALPNKPYTTQMEPGCQNSTCFKGIFAEVFQELQRLMNFTYTVEYPRDGQWGALAEDGRWTGMIGQLATGESDVAAADLSKTLERSQVVDFLPALDDPHQRIFIANPKDAFNWSAYTKPFLVATWFALLAFVLLAPPVILGIVKLGSESGKHEFGVGRSYTSLVGAVLMRPAPMTPTSCHSKVVCLTVLLFGILIYYHWEAMIISYVAVKRPALPFHSMQQMLDETDFKLVAQRGTAFVDNFRFSKIPLYQRIWKERMEPYLDTFPTDKNGLSAYIHSDLSSAMVDNYETRIFYRDYIDCRTLDIPRRYFPMRYAMPARKGLPYFQAMQYFTRNIKERGVLDRIKSSYGTEPQQCPSLSGRPLGLNQTFTAFLMLSAGLAAAFVFFGLEWMLTLLNQMKISRMYLFGG